MTARSTISGGSACAKGSSLNSLRVTEKEFGDCLAHQRWVLHLHEVIDPGHQSFLGAREPRAYELLACLEKPDILAQSRVALASNRAQHRLRDPIRAVNVEGPLFESW